MLEIMKDLKYNKFRECRWLDINDSALLMNKSFLNILLDIFFVNFL